MFANRITRFFMDDHRMDDYEEPLETSLDQAEPAFVKLPAFAGASASLAGPPDIYRVAYEQARQQVAARHERQRRMHEWN